MSTEPDDATIERFARKLILGLKGDPDMLVQLGTPQVYGTFSGDVFAVTPGAEVPLWRMYKTLARQTLLSAAEMLAPAPQPESLTADQLGAEMASLGIDSHTKSSQAA